MAKAICSLLYHLLLDILAAPLIFDKLDRSAESEEMNQAEPLAHALVKGWHELGF
jgi:hypothetical protein